MCMSSKMLIITLFTLFHDKPDIFNYIVYFIDPYSMWEAIVTGALFIVLK